MRQGPGEVDVGAGFRQLLLGLPRRLRAGDVDRTSAPRMADRAIDQGTLRVDELDPEVPRVVGPIADQVADSDMLMLRQLVVRVATRTATCVVWLPGAMSLRGMQPAGIRGPGSGSAAFQRIIHEMCDVGTKASDRRTSLS